MVTPGKANYGPERANGRQKCCICGATPCHRIVGRDGYCADHKADAFAAAHVAKQPKGWFDVP